MEDGPVVPDLVGALRPPAEEVSLDPGDTVAAGAGAGGGEGRRRHVGDGDVGVPGGGKQVRKLCGAAAGVDDRGALPRAGVRGGGDQFH